MGKYTILDEALRSEYEVQLKGAESALVGLRLINFIDGEFNLFSYCNAFFTYKRIIDECRECLVKLDGLSGANMSAFGPNNCNVNTSIMIYEHGDGDYYNDWQSYDEKFATDRCNSIVIRAARNNSKALYNHIVDYYNLNKSKLMTVSFCGETVYAMNEVAQMIKQNLNILPSLAVIMDGYVLIRYLLSNGVIDMLKESNTLVLIFAQSSNSNMYVSQYENMTKMGVSVVILREQSKYGYSYSGVNTSFMEGGVLEYTLGKGSLPDRYKIYVYDSETSEFVSLEH